MLHFFTDPYCEELISSVCARYHYYSGNINNKHTLVDLFGKDTVRAFKLFPARLSYLEKQLSNKSYTSDYFIYKHTIFPFYSPFISKDRQMTVINFMKFEGHSSIYNTLGISTSNINSKQGYMYCSECVNEDMNSFGEAYFHRIHQLQGVLVCHKHGCVLEEYDIDIEPNCKFTRLDSGKLKFENLVDYEKQVHETLLMVAKAAYFIFTLPYLAYNSDDIKDKIMYFLDERNYITHGNVVRQKKLLEDFLEYYNPVFLKLLNSDIINNKRNWIRDITQNKDRVVHPIRSILLILFLTDDNIKMFFELKADKSPFGKGPWPCLNIATEHYLKKVIDKCEVQYTYRSRDPKGIFKCNCGYVYSRKGPDKNEQDIFRVDKVLEIGQAWENKYKTCLEESNYNIKYTAKKMNCTKYQIKKYIENDKFTDRKKFGAHKKKDKFDEYSTEIIDFMNLRANCTRGDIHNNLKKQVSWFRRNNPEWMEENFPKRSQLLGTTKNIIDYKELDIEILSNVKRAHDELLVLEIPKRITVWVIEKYLNLRIKRRIHKLPRTKAFIDEIVETVDAFRLRRIKNFCDKLLQSQIKLSRTRILIETGILWKIVPDDLKQQINEIIDDYLVRIDRD